ncbi:MAG TPA: xanthine dehydrogenase family protein molybdopterin-binding subunit [Chloroflexota bacterium]|nr:xanthine dehydrogenase family protein molybdopterin-binding subunit [Chloroflexota bacterium]
MRIFRTRVEFEGREYEEETLWSGAEPPPWGPEAELKVAGRAVARVDAVDKVTGRARFTEDVVVPGMLYAAVLRSPHAHARVRRVDTRRAVSLDGVRAVLYHGNAPSIVLPNGEPIFDRWVRYYGQAVAAVAATTEERAREGIARIAVQYETYPFVTDPDQAAREGAPLVQPCGNRPAGHNPRVYERGDPRQGEQEAEVLIEQEFRTPVVVHQCFEPHCAVCWWDGAELTAWTSTQAVHAVADALAAVFGLPRNRVHVRAEAIGGGFGSKQHLGEEVVLAALLARQTGCPIKLSLDRDAESVATGHREATVQRVRLGARRDGTLTLIDHRAVIGLGAYGREGMSVTGPSRELYRCPNVHTEELFTYTNLAPARAFRGPGYTEGLFALESAMDDLARRLRLDPVELRLRNLTDDEPVGVRPYSSKPLDTIYRIGAAAAGWSSPKPAPSRPWRRRGRGMATQIWGGGGGPPAYAWIRLEPDGTAVVLVGSQDIGTGTRTALAQIAAEELGLPLESVRVEEGDSLYTPYGPTSAGSQTVSSIGPAVQAAAYQARTALLAIAADRLGEPADSLVIREGAICHGTAGERRLPIADLLRPLSPFALLGQGDRGPNPVGVAIRTFGAHFAEVEVDIETGEIFLVRLVAVHDCGRVISPLQARSQVAGGVIQGIGYSLTEELVVDPSTGIALNPNLQGYLLPTAADVPGIEALFSGEIDSVANSLGVKGLGEPPIIAVAPAIANAVADALGIRLANLPITRARILDALQRTREQTGARIRTRSSDRSARGH